MTESRGERPLSEREQLIQRLDTVGDLINSAVDLGHGAGQELYDEREALVARIAGNDNPAAKEKAVITQGSSSKPTPPDSLKKVSDFSYGTRITYDHLNTRESSFRKK